MLNYQLNWIANVFVIGNFVNTSALLEEKLNCHEFRCSSTNKFIIESFDGISHVRMISKYKFVMYFLKYCEFMNVRR